MAGNTLGDRRFYEYLSDTGKKYTIQTDKDLGDYSGGTLSSENPAPPRRFKPRGVYCQATIAGKVRRKFVIICDPEATAYAEDSSNGISIDGVTFFTTGRRGESYAYGIGNPALNP